MAFVSITRLRIRAWRFMPGFAVSALRSRGQCRRAPGFLRGSLLGDNRRTYWTMTLWRDEEAMRAYMAGGAHRVAMGKLREWCDEASVVHWHQDGDGLPSWRDAGLRMREQGRPSKVRHPTPGHATLAFPPPRESGAVNFGPA